MKSEMTMMRMDERQQLNWLSANRATLMFVGVVWLLMIAFELNEGRTPGFLIVMVPVIAGIRLGCYYYYARDRDLKWVDRVLFIGLVALGHWLATMVAWVREFATSGFLWLVPQDPSHGFWLGAARVLGFPLETLFPDGGANIPDLLGVALMAINSLIWAGAIYALVWAARGRRGEARGA